MSKLAICIPAYNYGRFLRPCLDSILKTKIEDMEVHVFDDGSTDNTEKVVKTYPTVHYHKHETNLGLTATFNEYLNIDAEYINICCADDVVHPWFLDEAVKVLDADATIGLAFCKRTVTNEKLEPINEFSFPNVTGKYFGGEIIRTCVSSSMNFIGEPTAVVFRKTLGKPFNPKYNQLADLDQWFHILSQSNGYYFSKSGTLFRQHGDNGTKHNIASGKAEEENSTFWDEWFDCPAVVKSIKNKPVVTAFVRDDGACGYYRIKLPINSASDHGLMYGQTIEPNTEPGQMIDKLTSANVVVIPRVFETPQLELMKKLQRNGVKVVIDHDDDIFHVSPLSPHYKEFGTDEVMVDLNGNKVHLWQDGKSIDLKANKNRIDILKESLEIADAVSVTQPYLAKVYKEFNDKVFTLPNCCDGNIWQRKEFAPRDTIRILWSGGSSHYQDVQILQNVFPRIAKKYPEVVFVIMGCEWDSVFGKIPKEQYEFHDWVATEAYPYKQILLDIDISLVPIDYNDFNRAKSNIKLVEQAFLRRPTIATYSTPYKEFYDNKNMILVSNDESAWEKALILLIENKEQRIEMGRMAEVTARANYDINTQAHLWADAYKGLL